MKKYTSLLLAVLLLVSLCVPANALSADTVNVTDNVVKRQSTNSDSATVTDNYNNRYYVLGHSTRINKNATVYTGFEVTYYYGGTDEDVARVNAYTKSLTASGFVTLSGGGQNSFGGTVNRTGASNSYSPSQTYIYNVTLVSGTHSFSCQGASWSSLTYM